MLSQRNTDYYAFVSGVARDTAGTNVVLTYVLKILSEEKNDSPILDEIVFKGGTCLRKIYFGKETRFSMDLDFTSNGIDYSEFKKRIFALLHQKTYYGITFRVEEYRRTADDPDVYGATINYSHEWRTSQFELQVIFHERPILPAKKLMLVDEAYWKDVDFGPFEILSMELEELIAEKIRAAFERTRSRDLYDLYIYSKEPFDESKVRTLTILKCWNNGTFFDPLILLQKVRDEKYDWGDLKRLVNPARMPDEKEIIRDVIGRFGFLRQLNVDQLQIQQDSKSHKRVDLVDKMSKQLQQ